MSQNENHELRTRLKLLVDEFESGTIQQGGNFVVPFYESIVHRQEQRIVKLTNLLKDSNLHEKLGVTRSEDISRVRRLLNELTDGLMAAAETEMSLGRYRKQVADMIKENNSMKVQLDNAKIEVEALRKDNESLSRAIATYTVSSTVEWSRRNAEIHKNEKLHKQNQLLQDCISVIVKSGPDTDQTSPSSTSPSKNNNTHSKKILPPVNPFQSANQTVSNIKSILHKTLRLNSDLGRQLKLSCRRYSMLDARHAKSKHDIRRLSLALQHTQQALDAKTGVSREMDAQQIQGTEILTQQNLYADLLKEGVACPGSPEGLGSGNSMEQETIRILGGWNSISNLQKDFLIYLSSSRGALAEAFFLDMGVREVKSCVDGLASQWYKWTIRDKLISKLLRVSERLHSGSPNLDMAVARIAQETKSLLKCDRASFWMVDNAANEMWTRIPPPSVHIGANDNGDSRKDNLTSGVASKSLGGSPEVHIPLGVGLVGVAWQSKASLNVPDAYIDSRFDSTVDVQTGYRTKSVLCVPIVQRVGLRGMDIRSPNAMKNGTVVAVLQCINKDSGGVFDEEDEFIVRMLGNFAAIVVDGCRKSSILSWVESRSHILMDTVDAKLKINSLKDSLKFLSDRLMDVFRAQEFQIVFVGKNSLRRIVGYNASGSKSIQKSNESIRYTSCSKSQGICGIVACTVVPLSIPLGLSQIDSRFDDTVDLSVQTRTRGWTLHSYPMTDPVTSSICAVLQFSTLAREATGTLGFNELLVEHAKILGNLVRMITPILREMAQREGSDWDDFFMTTRQEIK